MARWIVVCFLEILCVAVMCFGQEPDNKKVEAKYPLDEWLPSVSVFGGSGIAIPALPVKEADIPDSRQLVNFGAALEMGLSLELSYIGPANKFAKRFDKDTEKAK